MKIEKASTSNLDNVDFENLTFGSVFTDHMFVCEYKNGKWQTPEVLPYKSLSFEPSMSVLHYGQAVFEGMKATRTRNGDVVLFRPEMNAKRIRKSARRLCIPPIDETFFLNSVRDTVLDNIDYIPPLNKGNLYIRPIIWGTGPVLGVQPASEYTFLIYVVPVGPYFKNGIRHG